MDKRDPRAIEVEANVRKGLIFIEGFDWPIESAGRSIGEDRKIFVQIKPDGFFHIDGDGDTILSCYVMYEGKVICLTHYSVNQKKFVKIFSYGYINSDISYCAEVFMQYPYKYGKKIDRVNKFYQKCIDDMEFYASKDPSVEYKYARNLFEVMEHFEFDTLEFSRMINFTNNIFIKAYANARKRCNKGKINASLMDLINLKYIEPTYLDYFIELYKLENRLRYHGIDIPRNQKVSGLSGLRLTIEGFKTKFYYISDVMKKAMKYMTDNINTIQKIEEEGE